MWLAPVQTVAPTAPGIALSVAQTDLRITAGEDPEQDARLQRALNAGIARVEAISSTRLASQTVTIRCDCWADLAHMPIAPVTAVTSLEYIDAAGDDQTVDSSLYSERLEGLSPGLGLKYGAAWPSRQPGSLITATLVVGYASVPPDVVEAVLLLTAARFDGVDLTRAEEAAVTQLFNHRL